MESTILDCGHAPSEHTAFSTGYGTAADGKRYCNHCCAERDVMAMRERGIVSGYVSGDAKCITTWPGIMLATITSIRTHKGRRGYIGRGSYITYRAQAGDGSMWYGRSEGTHMVTTMRRVREPKRCAYCDRFTTPKHTCYGTRGEAADARRMED